MSLWSFQGARELEPAPQRVRRPEGRSLKTQQRDVFIEVDVVLGEPGVPTICRTVPDLSLAREHSIKGSGAYRHEIPDSLERR